MNRPALLDPPYFWSHLTREEIANLIDSGVRTAIIPFGSTEQHGPHLMTGNDYLFAEYLALDLAREFNALVLPPIPYGMADHHTGFRGTITINASVLIDLLTDLARSVEKSGIENLVICNGHGGNYGLIAAFASQWTGKLKILHDATDRMLFKSTAPFLTEFTGAELGIHAGLQETSIAMHTHPDYGVRRDKLEKGAMPTGSEWTSEEVQEVISNGLHLSTPNGVLGDARKSTLELGKRFYDYLLQMYVEYYAAKGLKRS